MDSKPKDTMTAEDKESIDQFTTMHPEGTIKMEEFKGIMKKAMPEQDTDKMAEHIFRLYDTNKDGSIEAVEFLVVANVMFGTDEKEILTKVFGVFDVDRDGYITEKE